MAFRNLIETDYQDLDLDVWRRVILASLAARLPGREADWKPVHKESLTTENTSEKR